MTSSILDVWSYTASQVATKAHGSPKDRVGAILPDGCRDVILVRSEHGPALLIQTRLQDRTQLPGQYGAATLTGFRLRPGHSVDVYEVARASRNQLLDPDLVMASVNEITSARRTGNDRPESGRQLASKGHVSRQLAIDEAIEALADSETTLNRASGQVGLRPRSLQRLFLSASLPPPSFWSQLARARRAGRDISGGLSIADVAARQGFVDQAHLSRHMRRWFGQPPGHLAVDQGFAAQISALGLGD